MMYGSVRQRPVHQTRATQSVVREPCLAGGPLCGRPVLQKAHPERSEASPVEDQFMRLWQPCFFCCTLGIPTYEPDCPSTACHYLVFLEPCSSSPCRTADSLETSTRCTRLNERLTSCRAALNSAASVLPCATVPQYLDRNRSCKQCS